MDRDDIGMLMTWKTCDQNQAEILFPAWHPGLVAIASLKQSAACAQIVWGLYPTEQKDFNKQFPGFYLYFWHDLKSVTYI